MKRITVLSLIAITGLISNARGQHWTQIIKSSYNYSPVLRSPYFIDSINGFTYDPGFVFLFGGPVLGIVVPSLQRTTNGGKTWTAITIFDSVYNDPAPIYTNPANSITQIYFVSRSRGYVSTAGHSGGIFETLDTGATWHRISPVRSFTGVYAVGNSIFATAIPANSIYNRPSGGPNGPFNGPLFVSRDTGLTWDSVETVAGLTISKAPEFQRVYGNRDSLIAGVYIDSAGEYIFDPQDSATLIDIYLVYSLDQGQTWRSALFEHNTFATYSALFIPPHSCRIFHQRDMGAYPKAPKGDVYDFLSAEPDYTKWDTSINELQTGAWIAGNGCAMYLCHAPENVDSIIMYRSTDLGASWQPLITNGQPTPKFSEIDDWDFQNVSVVGHGAIIYADSFDLVGASGGHSGGLWKSTDGGDGTLSAAALAPQFALSHNLFQSGNDTFSYNPCQPDSLQVYNQNIGCSYGKFDSISIVGLDPSEYSVISTHHCACEPMTDTSFITLQPKTSGTRDVTIHYHFTDDEFNEIDTSIHVTMMVSSSGTAVPLNLNFKSSAITAHAGDTLEIPVYLSGTATLGGTSITLPFGLDTNILRVIGFRPAIAGMTTGAVVWARGTGTVPLQDSGLTLNGDTIIGYLRCVVYLADTLATTITLQNASLNSATAPCTALSLTTDSVNILINGCGDQTLLQFMKTGKIPLGIHGITPNPASNEIDIVFESDLRQPISYELIDALGHTRAHDITEEHIVSLDASSLPQGIYFFRASTNDGFAVTRKVVIEH